MMVANLIYSDCSIQSQKPKKNQSANGHSKGTKSTNADAQQLCPFSPLPFCQSSE